MLKLILSQDWSRLYLNILKHSKDEIHEDKLSRTVTYVYVWNLYCGSNNSCNCLFRIVCVLSVANIGPRKFSVYNFLGVRSIPTSILCDSYHFAVTKLAFPLLVEASWFLIKPWILRIGYIIAQPCYFEARLLSPSLRSSKLWRARQCRIASIYIRILTKWFDFPRKDVRWETARTRKSHTNDYPAVDLTFDGKLRSHCMLNCVDFCRALENSRSNNFLVGESS